jgi:hypothetical protein
MVLRISGLICRFGVFVAALTSCGGSDLVLPNETAPGELTLIGGNNQSGPAGEALPESLVVKLLDRRGQPLSNQRVAFTLDTLDIPAPGAQISPDTVGTGIDGLARARWVLGGVSGVQTVKARVVGTDGLEVTFNAAVGVAGPSRLEAVSGDEQRARAGTALQDPLVVRVVDVFGNPVPGVTVEWDASQGSVDPASTVTGDDGQAVTAWTLGASTGSQSASASSAGLEGASVDFTATASAGSADRLVHVSGDDQSARVGSELEDPLVVQLVDQAGNGIPNRPVSWVVATGGGSVASANTLTNGEGKASTRWTMGPNPGGNSLNAVVSGVGVVMFRATATDPAPPPPPPPPPPTPSRLAFSVQPSDAEEHQRIEPPVQVVVLDEAGNPVTQGEFEITLELVGDGHQGRGDLDGERTELTHAGTATFDDLSVKRDGHYRLRALADGLPSVESDEFEIEED